MILFHICDAYCKKSGLLFSYYVFARWNYGTQTTAGVFSGDSNGTSGLGDSLVQDIEEDATRR